MMDALRRVYIRSHEDCSSTRHECFRKWSTSEVLLNLTLALKGYREEILINLLRGTWTIVRHKLGNAEAAESTYQLIRWLGGRSQMGAMRNHDIF